MNDALQQFLDDAFKPYGDFPARKDVQQELLTNLSEKYQDLKAEGKTDDEAYKLTIESFGDVTEIMEQVGHDEQPASKEEKQSMRQTIVNGVKGIVNAASNSRFRATSLIDADLAGAKLSGFDFSMSALMGANFDNAELQEAKFKASALKGASFAGADLTGSSFDSSDIQDVSFTNANLTNVTLKRCSFHGANFESAKLECTEFKQSDLDEIEFDGLTLNGVIFGSTSLKNTTFKDATLLNVSFHHSDVRHAIFDEATMDKVTYALLNGMKADVKNVTLLK